jgi:glycosyltransferase involved in cell wall biosynthesis
MARMTHPGPPARAVLFVSPWLQAGGIERQLQIKATWFARRGYRVEVVSWFIADELSGHPNPVLETFEQHAIRVHRLRTWGNRLQLGQRALQVAMRAWSGRFPLVVGHELAGNLVALVAKLILANRVRVIAEVHTPSDIYSETGLSAVTIGLARRLYPRADGILAVSDTVARDAADFFRLDRRRLVTIYNPFRLAEIRSLAHHAPAPPGERPFIVACGRLVAMKGFAELIRAFGALRDRIDADLVILGEGPQRADLLRCAREAGVADRVRLPGFAANPFGYFSRARAFVLPSMLRESFSRVLVEAMACGVPVIASRCGGPEEILGDGRYGVLYPMGDVDALARNILRILEHPGEAAALAAAARSRAADWSEEKILPQIERYYVHGVHRPAGAPDDMAPVDACAADAGAAAPRLGSTRLAR